MANVVGIDLGTTYSAIARLDPSGRAEVVRDGEGHNLTPSVVLIEVLATLWSAGRPSRRVGSGRSVSQHSSNGVWTPRR